MHDCQRQTANNNRLATLVKSLLCTMQRAWLLFVWCHVLWWAQVANMLPYHMHAERRLHEIRTGDKRP